MPMGLDVDILAMGLNHHTAPVDVRERLALDSTGVLTQLKRLRETGLAREALIVSTCNRVELYAVPGEGGVDPLRMWFGEFRGPKGADVSSYLFEHRGMGAVQHLFRVASSLDSMVVGEPRILGQVKEAVRIAEDGKSLGRVLGAVARNTLKVAKKVRTETDIGKYTVGVGNAGVELALQIFGDLDGRRAMLVGVGDMGQQVAHALQSAGLKELLVANRTAEHAVEFANEHRATPVAWERMREYLSRVDIVVAATGAQEAIITNQDVRRALRERRYRPLFLVDLAVPRNIDPRVDDLEGAYLFNVDDLRQVIAEGVRARQAAKDRAEEVVAVEADRCFHALSRVEVGPEIGRLTQFVDGLRQAELDRSQRLVDSLDETQREQLEKLTKALVKRVLHAPLQGIHRAAEEGDAATLEALLSLWKEEE